MPVSTDVTLTKSVKAEFPEKCVVCHSKPDSTIKIAQNSSNAFLAFFIPLLMIFGWSKVELPICTKCKPKFRWQRWGRELMSWGVIIIAVWLIMPHFSDWSRWTRRITVGGLVILAIIPNIIFEVLWPRIFNTTAQGDTVDYEFADEEYAVEFYELNRSHVIKSDIEDSLDQSLGL